MIEQDKKTFSEWIRILLTAFFARLRYIIIIPVVTGIIALAACYLLPPIYEGNFSILVKAPEIDKTALTDDTSIVMRPGLIMENIITDEIYLLQSQTLYQNIAETLDDIPDSGYLKKITPDFILKFFELIGQSMDKAGSIDNSVQDIENTGLKIAGISSVERLIGSDLIEVTIRHHDPDQLRSILKKYASAYMNFRETIWFNRNAVKLLENQKNIYFESWQKRQHKLIDFKNSLNLIDPVQERINLQDKLINSDIKIIDVNKSLTEFKKQLNYLKRLPASETITFLPEKTDMDNMFREIKMRIGLAKVEHSQLLQKFQNEAYEIKKSNYRLNLLYKEYKKLLESYLLKKISATEIQLQSLKKIIKDNKSRFVELKRYEQHAAVLKEDIDSVWQQYITHRNKTHEIKMQNDLRKVTANVKIVSPPLVNKMKPFWPNIPVVVSLSVLLSFMAVSFIVVIIHIQVDSFCLPEEVSKELKLPVLESFPFVKKA